MSQNKLEHKIGIFLPPSQRGPGMIKSPPLDVANVISILKEGKIKNIKVFDQRAHIIAQDSFWKRKKVNLDVFNDFELCVSHILKKSSPKINLTVKQIINETSITSVNYIIFFVSVLEQFSIQYFNSSLCIASQIKKSNSSVKIIFFGNCPKKHITNIMNQFKFLDAFIINGDEYAVLDYINRNKTHKIINNVIYRNKNTVFLPKKTTPLQLGKYPLPDFSFFDLEKYKSNDNLVFPYELSRGCINNCFFCYYIYKGGTIYKKSYKNAVKELLLLKFKYNVSVFHFIDAEINFNNVYLENFCKELIKQKVNIKWSALAIPSNLNTKLLELMKLSGCIQLRFGVESGGQHLLEMINKNTTIQEMTQVLRDTHQTGIYTYITIINGLPSENKKDILETKNFLFKNRNYIDSATICDYGELGHFGVHILENLLKKTINNNISQEIQKKGRLLRLYSKKIGLHSIDIIDDFLSKK